jgi:hypothetical protein
MRVVALVIAMAVLLATLYRSYTVYAMTTPALNFQTIPFGLSHLSQPKILSHSCNSTTASTVREFDYNITNDNVASQQWRFLDISPASSREMLRGMVEVSRGNIYQASDIVVKVIIKSTQEQYLHNVIFNPTESSLGMDYIAGGDKDNCTEVQVIVFLRPWPRRLLHIFEIRSSILHIRIDGSLEWEINNLITHTAYGDSDYEGVRLPDPLITHNVSASSVSGDMYGGYLANGHLKLRNERGNIGFFLVPRFDEIPFEPESISISTASGFIHVQGTFGPWKPQAFTHRTHIHSDSGDVYAEIPHGSVTNISSGSGDIFASIYPLAADTSDAQSEIYTISSSGNTDFYIHNVRLDTLEGKFDPLLNTTSKHEVGEGKLQIWYPYSWYGNMEGTVESGSIEFDASALDKFEKGDGWVRARRGKAGHSVMEARVREGVLDVKMGI